MTEEPAAAEPDESLAVALRGLGRRIDPEPPEVAEAASRAFSARRADQELATLVSDSFLADADADADADGTVDPAVDPRPSARRRLVFAGPTSTVEMQVYEGRALVGQVGPGRPASVELCGPTGASVLEADEHGCFSTTVLPPGPLRLRYCAEGTAVVATDWVILG